MVHRSDPRLQRALDSRRRAGAAAKHGERGTRGWRKLHLGAAEFGVAVGRRMTEAKADNASGGGAIRRGSRTPSSGTSRSSAIDIDLDAMTRRPRKLRWRATC